MSLPETFFLGEPDGVNEHLLQEQWSRIPQEKDLHTSNGQVFRVHARGEWNHGPGPDFLDAVLEFGSEVRRGDVEIHFRASDWIAHKHGTDPAYGNVILHAVEINDATPSSAPFLPEVPVCLLPDLELDFQGRPTGECTFIFRDMEDSAVVRFVKSAGKRRIVEKSHIILSDMIAHGAEYAFWNAVFRLLGVPENREAFQDLFRRVRMHGKDECKRFFSAIVWGESGFLPDPADRTLAEDVIPYITRLWQDWWKIRKNGNPAPEFIRRSRPVNSPERRIALIAAMHHTFPGNPFPRLREIFQSESARENARRAIAAFDFHDPFWDCRFSFRSMPARTKTALAGAVRRTSLLTDVLLPAMLAYAELKEDSVLRSRVLECFHVIPQRTGNRVTRQMIDACFAGRADLFRTAAAHQGLLCLYKEFCGKKCV